MKYLLTLLVATFLFTPLLAGAQGFVPCDGVNTSAGGVACTECHLLQMGNTILVWLIMILFIVFGFVAAAAGWGLITAGGNVQAVSDAKSKFTNAIIGLIIVLAAWLIVDTIMRGLLNGGDLGTTYSGFSVWSEVQCGSMASTQAVVTSPEGLGDTFAGTGVYDPRMVAALGSGNPAIVAFAQAMDAMNCAYSQPLRNACAGTPAYTDCSDLVNNAYQAAGCSSPGTFTGDMIGNATTFTSNAELRQGDALIHRTGGAGHVVICMDDGCNRVIHAAGTSPGIIVSNGATYYNDPRYTSAIRAADFCP